MEQSTIDFKGGIVEHSNLPYLFTDTSIDISYLEEDILLVDYGDKCLDLGFYGDNKLRIRVIKEEDWQNPIYDKRIKRSAINKRLVFEELNKAIDFIVNG